MKYWGQKLATYVYKYCNISIYFYNIHLKQLQYIFKTFETLEMCACNVCFQAQHLLIAWTNGGVEAKLDAAEQARTLAGAKCATVWGL
jgi:hypothetical protein